MGADRAFLSRRRMSTASAVRVRGKCLAHRRPLATRPSRNLAGARATLARRAVPRGGMTSYVTHRFTASRQP